ncbi:MAG: HAMP domain-containing protein [Planctomycetes bacterium]|nr:HAMP domain-containing protein [Planctomycetota bacterium]
MRLTIRRRILLWYVALAALLIGGFSAAIYWLVERSTYAALDDALAARGAALAALVERERVDDESPDDEAQADGGEAGEQQAADADARGHDHRREHRAPRDQRQRPFEIVVDWNPTVLAPYEQSDPTVGYMVVDRESGRVVERSALISALGLREGDLVAPETPASDDPGPAAARTIRAPAGARLRVLARDYRIEHDEPDEPEPPIRVAVALVENLWETDALLSRLAATLAAIAPAGLAVALALGWFLSRRIVDPIAAITAAAEKVREANLAHRVPRGGSGDEIDRLADALNAAFERLRLAWQQQARFTADAAHELRTPVTILRTRIEVSARSPRTTDEYRAVLADALAAVVRMQETVEALLLLARLDAGAATPVRERFDLSALLARAAADHAGAAQAKSLAIRVESPPGLLCHGDRRLIGVAVSNLIANAVRYSDRPGEILVEAAADDAHGGVTCSVTDHGVGIPAEQLPRLFDRFNRADPSRSRADGGAGLGLSICQSILAAHGGRIAVESQPGVRTLFRFHLPGEAAGAPREPRA